MTKKNQSFESTVSQFIQIYSKLLESKPSLRFNANARQLHSWVMKRQFAFSIFYLWVLHFLTSFMKYKRNAMDNFIIGDKNRSQITQIYFKLKYKDYPFSLERLKIYINSFLTYINIKICYL